MLSAPLRRLPVSLLDLVLPRAVPGCGASVAEAGALCPACWRAIEFLTPPCCPRCAYPFEFEVSSETLCAACLPRPPVYDRGRAVLRYDFGSRSMLLAFKHADRTRSGSALRALAGTGRRGASGRGGSLAPGAAPWTRLWTRRYNQAAVLAQRVAAEAGPPFPARPSHQAKTHGAAKIRPGGAYTQCRRRLRRAGPPPGANRGAPGHADSTMCGQRAPRWMAVLAP